MGRTARRAIGVALRLWGLIAGVVSLQPGVAAPARTAPAPVAPGDLPPPMADGRMLGHLRYGEVARANLVAAPRGFAIGAPCLIHRDAAPDLARMLAAVAGTPGVGTTLRGVSCFRSVTHQRAVFCRSSPPGRCPDPARRARFVGPPGYSEHATGYAIDFGARPSPGCADVDSCLALTPAGRWLIDHAPEYGFELSFPVGNAQGVTWEPWHWRWVGTSLAVPGAAQARAVFARARTTYPALPGIAGTEAMSAPVPVILPPPEMPPISDRPPMRRR